MLTTMREVTVSEFSTAHAAGAAVIDVDDDYTDATSAGLPVVSSERVEKGR